MSKESFEEFYKNVTPFDVITNHKDIKCAFVNLFYDKTWKDIEATHGIAYGEDIDTYLSEIDEIIVELIDYRNRLKEKYNAEVKVKEGS